MEGAVPSTGDSQWLSMLTSLSQHGTRKEKGLSFDEMSDQSTIGLSKLLLILFLGALMLPGCYLASP